ncbi:uncharacterized protein N7506_001549 [Penicillium brevicompactum]|uniref:uncharacterized protein n=1 Tax=Penicillium brevicompactum TaxID=5074 RepID=UPI002541568C|nr:uncharacterized protein N7506_001549 [Penicillium brevicompactum]KAJ5348296.1 hypothetical protein N7506_001549 [Penicillium brevicompactum]
MDTISNPQESTAEASEYAHLGKIRFLPALLTKCTTDLQKKAWAWLLYNFLIRTKKGKPGVFESQVKSGRQSYNEPEPEEMSLGCAYSAMSAHLGKSTARDEEAGLEESNVEQQPVVTRRYGLLTADLSAR